MIKGGNPIHAADLLLSFIIILIKSWLVASLVINCNCNSSKADISFRYRWMRLAIYDTRRSPKKIK